ncbi:PREDICTED: cystatin-like [Gekko japonicus]|uniref:Cystatin-like n=1 Tax=Gekko japonicus TaxID=146911 RepID=A0ABM1JXX4_GEKJA|nr:PREDICTED: cystatin-like [Gekko japonicus]
MASASRCLLSGALRGLLLCMLMLLPVFTADHRMLVGGWRDRSVSDPDVQDAAAVAVNHYNEVNNNVFYCRALAILKAQSQVVEGIKYYLKMLLVTTECDKRSKQGSGHLDLGECRVPPRREQQRQICKFYVWSRPWLNDTHVTNMSCGRATS